VKTILIVDDDQSIQELLSSAFNDYSDYKAIAAEDGEAALDLVRLNNPDLILVDMMMPRIGGIALLIDLKKAKKTKNIPVILMSGIMKHKTLQKEGIEMGAEAYFTKPLDINKMLDKIKSILDG